MGAWLSGELSYLTIMSWWGVVPSGQLILVAAWPSGEVS